MNKYLLMSAAAVLSTTATSYAAKAPVMSSSGHTSFYSTTGGGGAYCNEWSVYWSGAVVGNQDNLSEYCGYTGWVSNGVALKGKVHGYGKVIQLPASIATIEGAPSFGSDFVVSGGQLASGESYVGWGTFEAYSNYEFSSGSIQLGQASKAKNKLLTNGHPTPVQSAMFKYAKDHGLPMKSR